jgi:hypothetical protein
MRAALFIPQKDFNDETVSILRLIFSKWSIHCDIASYGATCIGMHGAVYKADLNASKLSASNYDVIALVDGEGVDNQKVYDYRPLLDVINYFNDARKPIIGVGNAVKIPARANIVRGRKAVASDEETRRLITLFYGVPSKNSIEVFENLITVRDAKAVENSAELILQRMGVS